MIKLKDLIPEQCECNGSCCSNITESMFQKHSSDSRWKKVRNLWSRKHRHLSPREEDHYGELEMDLERGKAGRLKTQQINDIISKIISKVEKSGKRHTAIKPSNWIKLIKQRKI